MKNKKRRVITDKEQTVAVDILSELIIEVMNSTATIPEDFVDKIMKRYDLFTDPFTHMPCTTKEYCSSSIEYDRQGMMHKYGHCDGID